MTADYKDEEISVEYLSDALVEECASLIGETIKRVEAREHSFSLIFTDNTVVKIHGARWDGCSLGVDLESGDCQ